MSHFSVAVFHRQDQSVDELLAPYDEGLRVEPYIEFTRQQAIDYARQHYKSMAGASDEDCYNYLAEDYDEEYRDAEGNLLTTYNPKSRWDWYTIGGRFPGRLKARTGEHGEGSAFADNPKADGAFDVARVGDIDFSPDPEVYARAARFWEVYVEGKPLQPGESGEQFQSFYRKEYYLDQYKNKETFAAISASFTPFACVTPDGEWHERGKMGWFACSSETPEEGLDWDLHFKERFLDTADPDWMLTMVDCHI